MSSDSKVVREIERMVVQRSTFLEHIMQHGYRDGSNLQWCDVCH